MAGDELRGPATSYRRKPGDMPDRATATAAAVSAILSEAGFKPSKRAECAGRLCAPHGRGWRIAGEFDGEESEALIGGEATDIADPIGAAHDLVRGAKQRAAARALAVDLEALERGKLGRLSQNARQRKAALQEGWTLEEFRALQNAVQRIERGEAPDDPEARARFFTLSERSRAMSLVEDYRARREAELQSLVEAGDRAAVEAFDPDACWPEAMT